jgi:hypothetical protein
VGVKLIFLIVTRAVSLLGLSRREWWWKDAEILMLRQAPRMNSIMERWIGRCRRKLLDRTLIWNQRRHLMTVLREYEDFCNSHRPHRALDQAAPLRPPARSRHRPGSFPGPAA